MGTTLTGTTPQDTYDSLIKVTDNGPLSGSLKALSDGLGNDSTLSLSTTAASIAGTLAVTGATTLSSTLVAQGTGSNTVLAGTGLKVRFNDSLYLNFSPSATGGNVGEIASSENGLRIVAAGSGVNSMTFLTSNSSGVSTERMRLDGAGNVGIGTSTPTENLAVSGSGFIISSITSTGNSSRAYLTTSAKDGSGNTVVSLFGSLADSAAGVELRSVTSHPLIVKTNNTEVARFLVGGGLTFNGDTAAANALDDYEEGTWTMGVSFGGASAGVTYNANTGNYTKVGRKVTVSGYIALTSKGSSTGNARVTGLPFTSLSGDSNLTAVTLWYNNTTFVGQFQGLVRTGQNYIDLTAITELGAIASISDTNFANNTEIILNVTYFV